MCFIIGFLFGFFFFFRSKEQTKMGKYYSNLILFVAKSIIRWHEWNGNKCCSKAIGNCSFHLLWASFINVWFYWCSLSMMPLITLVRLAFRFCFDADPYTYFYLFHRSHLWDRNWWKQKAEIILFLERRHVLIIL